MIVDGGSAGAYHGRRRLEDDLQAARVNLSVAQQALRMLQALLDSERRHADELVQRIIDVNAALGEHRTPGRPLAEDVRGLAEKWSGVQLAWSQPLPVGHVLKPEHFGLGEAGVLRLAALLAEAPEGAVVREAHGAEWVRGPQPRGWVWRSAGVPALTAVGMARLASLTVVEWPASAS